MQFKRFVFALLAILALGMQQQAFAKQKAEKENKHSSSDHHHKSKSVRSPWIEYKNGVNVFKFNVFNLDPVHVDQKKLKKICKAVEKATCKYFQPSYGTRADIRVYPASESLNPDLFNGDRIPMYVLDSMVFDEFG
ncbi:MAG: hypothetical protein JSS12_11245, partial [Verrucomicrobia bacterium]|nr:hypothetical protein [Verrucomicrobiota bacterium]